MAVGGTPLKRQKRIFSHRILADEKKCARGGSGEIHPPMGGSPLGGAHGQGVRTASPYRPAGRMGLTGRAPGRGGGRQAASKQRASKKANGWEPPGGRTGRGAHGKPQSPVGRRGLPGAALGGAGENCSRQGYRAPELRGRRGLTSSICVISACANIHRISPYFVLRLIMEPRGICLSWCKHDRSHKDSKEPRGIRYRFFPIAPHLQRGNMRKNDFFGRQGTCAPELRGLNRG